MISKIIFAGDPYRGDQAINIGKTASLFMPILKQLGVSTDVFITDINKCNNRDEWIPSWKSTLLAYPGPALATTNLEGAAVVGFEMPDAELTYLSEFGIPWVNFCIHPIRFLDDLYFDVSTSFEYDINKIAATPGAIDFCANRIIDSHPNDGEKKEKDSLLVCAQVWFDRSIFFDNEFKQLDSYIDELDHITRLHNKVLYRPHPLSESKRISELMVERYGAQSCDVSSIYDAFVTQGIKSVCAISSSVLVEAPSFGIQSIYLEPRAKRYGPAVGFKALMDDVDFWGNGLLRREEALGASNISSIIPANFVRKAFGSWSFVTDEMRAERRLIEIESDLQQRLALVQQAESSAQQAESSAQQAESSAQQAESSAQQAESRAQQAESRAQQAESRAQQAESRALLAESKEQLAEFKEQLAEFKGQQAESRAQQAESKTQQAELSAQQAEFKAQQAELLSVQHTAQLQAVYASTSWRITAPMRVLSRLVRSNSRNEIKEHMQTVLKHAVLYVNCRPRLRHGLLGILNRMPGVKRRLTAFKTGASTAPAVTPKFPIDRDIRHLSPQARKIYIELKDTIKSHQNAGN